MIVSFGDKATEDLFHGVKRNSTKRFPRNIINNGTRKLDSLNAANFLRDLHSTPGNRLEALKGKLKGFYSIRINDQWRIIFKWSDPVSGQGGNAYDVKIVDYH